MTMTVNEFMQVI